MNVLLLILLILITKFTLSIDTTIISIISLTLYIIINILYKIINKKKNLIVLNEYNQKKDILFLLIISLIVSLLLYNDIGISKTIVYTLITIIILLPEKPKLYTKYSIDNPYKKTCINIINTSCKDKKMLKEIHKANIEINYDKNNKEDINKIIKEIKISRGVIDNLIKVLSIRKITSLSLVLSIIIMVLIGYPIPININTYLLLTITMKTIVNILLPYMTFDTDIMNRLPRLEKVLQTKQELVFDFMQSLIAFFVSTVPYMFSLSNGGSEKLSCSLFITAYLITTIIILLMKSSEQPTIINIINLYKNVSLLFIIIVLLLIMINIHLIPFFELTNIGTINYTSIIILCIIFNIWFDIIKLARFTKIRKES